MDLWSEKLVAKRKPSLSYACYMCLVGSGGNPNYYAYAKAPLGSSLVMYKHTDGMSIATSSSQLVAVSGAALGNVWLSVTENYAEFDLLGKTQAPRHKAGDIYE